MKKSIFEIFVYIDEIDADKIEFVDEEKIKYPWHTYSFFTQHLTLTENSYEYLHNILLSNIQEDFNKQINLNIVSIWENHYTYNSYQAIHRHDADFSFIIYKTIEVSKTVFINPIWETLNSSRMQTIKGTWKPNIKQNNILIFPSFLLHYVSYGADGINIAGDIKLS